MIECSGKAIKDSDHLNTTPKSGYKAEKQFTLCEGTNTCFANRCQSSAGSGSSRALRDGLGIRPLFPEMILAAFKMQEMIYYFCIEANSDLLGRVQVGKVTTHVFFFISFSRCILCLYSVALVNWTIILQILSPVITYNVYTRLFLQKP